MKIQAKKITLVIFAAMLSVFLSACNQSPSSGNAAVAKPERMIQTSLTINAGLDAVWQAWTTKEGITTFFSPEANIDLRPGGAFEPLMDPAAPVGLRGADGMVFLAVQDKKMISFTWNAPPALAEARKQRTVVVVRFEARGDLLTEVTLTHLGWGAIEDKSDVKNEWGKTYDYFQQAWPNVLKNLQARFKSGPIDWKPWLDRLEAQRKSTDAIGRAPAK